VSDRPGEMDERDVDERFASIVAGWGSALPGDGTDDEGQPADDARGATPAPGDTDDSDGTDDGDGSADDAEAVDDDAADGSPSAPEPGARPPWVNPSPLDVVLPASSWRVSPPPAGAAPASRRAEPDDADDHYEPPPVTLPPQEDLHFWGAVVGLVGGPLLLLYVALARPFHSDRWFAAGVVLSLVGFGLLVLRQPRHRDPTDGDDGARV
jgi:hypothetical protein